MANRGLLLINSSGASNSDEFTFRPVHGEKGSIFVEGLAGVETLDLQYTTDDGATWANLPENGADVQATVTNLLISISTPGQFRLNVLAAVGTIRATWVQNKDL